MKVYKRDKRKMKKKNPDQIWKRKKIDWIMKLKTYKNLQKSQV